MLVDAYLHLGPARKLFLNLYLNTGTKRSLDHIYDVPFHQDRTSKRTFTFKFLLCNWLTCHWRVYKVQQPKLKPVDIGLWKLNGISNGMDTFTTLSSAVFNSLFLLQILYIPFREFFRVITSTIGMTKLRSAICSISNSFWRIPYRSNPLTLYYAPV